MKTSLLLFLVLCSPVSAQQTDRVSVSTAGVEGAQWSEAPTLSADGRYVAFTSLANNLVGFDTNLKWDSFLHDRNTGVTTRVSVDSSGVEGNDNSYYVSLSADGKFIAFTSFASNLVAGDTNGVSDVFFRDLQTLVTTRISVDSFGVEAVGGDSGSSLRGGPSISANGRFISFESSASNLVAGDTNGHMDVFVHDRISGETTRVSVDSSGAEANSGSMGHSISANGRFVAFSSLASNLVSGDSNLRRDVFVHDRLSGQTTRVSLDSLGGEGNDNSGGFSTEGPSISANGQFVAFESDADNLITGDTNGATDVFVHDRVTGVTSRVSVDSAGVEGNNSSQVPSASADGRFIAFSSDADNFVPAGGDTNGVRDVFLHDRQSGNTTRVSVATAGAEGNDFSDYPFISAAGRFIAFEGDADNLVPGDTNAYTDVFVRNRGISASENTIILTGPFSSPVGVAVDLSWYAAPVGPGVNYYLYYSLNLAGTLFGGHSFDLGPPTVQLATGLVSATGTGTYTSPPVVAGAAGHTVYLEVATLGPGGRLDDSIVQAISFY
ncbi:MAG: PD40 domain-containing protein [Planctomycetes bacterium]|nr:PD40 domain-containing protein [Planctomycetota bacterium]